MPYAIRKQNHYYQGTHYAPKDSVIFVTLDYSSAKDKAEKLDKVCGIYLLSHGEYARPEFQVINCNLATYAKHRKA